MPGAQNIINALKGYTSASHNEATNAANREVTAFDPERALFVQGSGRRAAASPSIHYQRARDVRGEMESTGRVGDLAIDKGQGFFVVKTKTGTTALSNMGSFRIREVDQKIVGPSGEVLMGWALDAQGKRPENGGALESLIELSTKQLTAQAVATDKVDMSVNLKQTEKVKDGPGRIMSIPIHTIIKSSDLIAPGESNTESFLIGNQLKLTPGGANATESIFEYGGMSISRKPTTATGQSMYTATAAGGNFTVLAKGSTATSNDHIVAESGLTIRLGAGGEKFDFVATNASNEAALGRFNSLTTLAAAINSTTGGKVRARVDDGRLLIAAKDANDALVFENIKPPAGNLLGAKEVLGLIDVPAKGVNDPQRYASLDELRDKVNNVEALSAEIIDGKKMRFGAADARGTLAVKGETYRPRNYQRAFASGSTIDSDRRFGVNIESPSHGLQTGDYVSLAGGLQVNAGNGAQNVPDGMYRITRVNDDVFTIAQQNILQTAAGVGTTPAANAALTVTSATGLNSLTWRRVEGLGVALPADNGNNTTISNNATDYETATITLAAAPNNIDALGANDLVYVANSTVLQDGFYRINAVAGNVVTLDFRYANGTIDLKVANTPPRNNGLADPNVTLTRVSTNAGTMETFPITIAHNTTTVTVQKPQANHQYSVGDIIMFTDLATTTIKAGTGAGVDTITENTPYKITNVNANSFTFEYTGTAVTASAGNSAIIGYTNRDSGAGVAGANIDANAGFILGENAQIQNLTKSFAGKGVNTDEDFFRVPLAATYNGDPASGKNIASGATAAHQTFPANVYDAFGNDHLVKISYIKLTDREWGVEIWVDRDADGTYPVNGENQVAYGNIKFDGEGQIQEVDPILEAPIAFAWNNGSDTTSVTFDFGLAKGKLGVTMLDSPYDTRFMDNNGSTAGALETIEYQTDGTVVARFTNGSSRAFAQLPVAVVPDPNSLIAIGAGHFVESLNRSGAIVLKVAGIGGAGTFLPGFLEASKADENEALLNMTELNHLRMIALKAVAKEEEVNQAARQWL